MTTPHSTAAHKGNTGSTKLHLKQEILLKYFRCARNSANLQLSRSRELEHAAASYQSFLLVRHFRRVCNTSLKKNICLLLSNYSIKLSLAFAADGSTPWRSVVHDDELRVTCALQADVIRDAWERVNCSPTFQREGSGAEQPIHNSIKQFHGWSRQSWNKFIAAFTHAENSEWFPINSVTIFEGQHCCRTKASILGNDFFVLYKFLLPLTLSLPSPGVPGCKASFYFLESLPWISGEAHRSHSCLPSNPTRLQLSAETVSSIRRKKHTRGSNCLCLLAPLQWTWIRWPSK